MSRYSVRGLVATTPRHLITQEGLAITSFRLAEYDSTDPSAETNWFTINAFEQLAVNVAQSVNKGDRVVLTGNLKVRDWDNGERTGTSVEIEADSIGHDIGYGTSVFTRVNLLSPEQQKQADAEEAPKHKCNCNKCDRK